MLHEVGAHRHESEEGDDHCDSGKYRHNLGKIALRAETLLYLLGEIRHGVFIIPFIYLLENLIDLFVCGHLIPLHFYQESPRIEIIHIRDTYPEGMLVVKNRADMEILDYTGYRLHILIILV